MKTILKVSAIAGLAAVAIFFLSRQQKQETGQTASRSKQEQEIYELKLGHDMSSDSAQNVASLKFADIVSQRSGDRIRVKVFPAQQLGTDHQMIEAARAGELAIILPPTAKLSTLAPSMQYADLPFLFPSREDAYELLDGKIGKILLDRLRPFGLIGVAFWESGFKQFTANKATRYPEDFKGLNVRVMKSTIIMEQFKAFGANPVPIDFHRTYQALKDGAVVAQENALVSIVNMKLYEVQSHVIISNHAYLCYVFAFSKKILESLPADIREILIDTARELTPFERKETIERENAFLQTIRDSGTEVVYLSEAERVRFEVATRPIVEKYRSLIGTAIMDETDRFLRKRFKPGKDDIVIGLDADLTLGSAPSGLAIKRGMGVAIDEINQKGGVLGKQLCIMARDHGGISARGIANMNHFSKVENLAAVLGGLHSPVALAELKTIHDNKLIYLDPWAAATPIVDNGFSPNYVFRVSVRDEYAGDFLVNQALKKYRKVALLLENTGWGRSNHKAMIAALAKRDLTPAAVEWFNWGEKDHTIRLESIATAGAEVILLVANAPEGIDIIRCMAKQPTRIPVISHWGITGGYFWEQVNRELNLVDLQFLQTFSFMNPQSEKTRNVSQRYFETYGEDSPGKIMAPVGTAHAYDLVHLLAIAIERAGSLDRARIREELEKIDSYHGLVKHYSPPFTRERHDALDQSDFIMARYNNQGCIVPEIR